MIGPVTPSTVESLRQALAEAITCSAQELQESIGRIVFATAADLPASADLSPAARSVLDPETRTTVLLADRIPAGEQTAAIAQELVRWHGEAAGRVLAGGAAENVVSVSGGQALGLDGWSVADEYTKDLLPGAAYMRTIGGRGTPFVPYDFTIAQLDSSTWVPIQGSVRMPAVPSAAEAAQTLLNIWHQLPQNQKLSATYPVDVLREGWKVQEWLAPALPPGVPALWSVYDRNGDEIGRAQTRDIALEKAWIAVPASQTQASPVADTESRALELRRQALALLQEAEGLDSLKPYVIRHEHRWGEEERLVWAAAEPSHEAAKKSVGYQEWQNEVVTVQQCFPLEQLTGADPKARWNDAVSGSPEAPSP